jgi:hypothetical protein
MKRGPFFLHILTYFLLKKLKYLIKSQIEEGSCLLGFILRFRINAYLKEYKKKWNSRIEICKNRIYFLKYFNQPIPFYNLKP